MLFGADLAPVFGRGFDWKVLNAQALESPISVPNSDSQCTLAHLSLELTINDYDPYIEYKNIDHYAKRTSFNDLSDEGMKPKTYTVRLQSGRFPRPVMLDLYDKDLGRTLKANGASDCAWCLIKRLIVQRKSGKGSGLFLER